MNELRAAILKHLVGRTVTANQMAFLLGKGDRDVAEEMGKLHRERLIEGTLDDKGFWIYEALTDPTTN